MKSVLMYVRSALPFVGINPQTHPRSTWDGGQFHTDMLDYEKVKREIVSIRDPNSRLMVFQSVGHYEPNGRFTSHDLQDLSDGPAEESGRFWVIWNPESVHPPKVRFASREKAEEVATVMAAKHGAQFYVLEATSVADKPVAASIRAL